ncbi:hypothetical protein GQ457_14G019150 [Hibiscus cannabinus]
MLRRYRSDLSHVMPVEEIELYTDMSYDEEPVEILTSDGKVLRGRTIELVKVKWRHRGMEEATWERKEDMREWLPCLFPSSNFEDEISLSGGEFYNVELMFAASFDSKMGCLYSVFDVKKQGKTVWVVRARNWKLRGGENRLSGLLEGVSVTDGLWYGGGRMHCMMALHEMMTCVVMNGFWFSKDKLVLKLHCCCYGFEHRSLSFQAYALFPTMQIASLGEGKEARRIHLDLCSSTVFENYVQSDVDLTPDWDTVFFAALIITIGRLNAFRKHNKKVLNFRVVYRSWTFRFDSDIPRVTISGRFCDWTGSRGLQYYLKNTKYS